MEENRRILNGRYRLDDLLGSGGFATVYRATDLDLKRTVAVKILHARYAQHPDFLSRFSREAEVVARLEHPNILTIYDKGQAGGNVYLVLPFIDGGSLADRLEEVGAVPLDEAATTLTTLAAALDHAHEQGLVHRDVKPQNVLVGRNGRLVLADFGIAKVVAETSPLTAAGDFIGSASYAAPEQFSGTVSVQSDVYALGCLLFQLLTGELPYPERNPLVLMHLHNNAPIPSAVARSGGTLPATVDAVLATALAKDPAARFASAGAFAKAFAAAVQSLDRTPSADLAPADPPAEAAVSAPLPEPDVRPVAGPTPPAFLSAERLRYLVGALAVTLLVLALVVFGLVSRRNAGGGTPTVRAAGPRASATVPSVTVPVAGSASPAAPFATSAGTTPVGGATANPPTTTTPPGTPVPTLAVARVPIFSGQGTAITALAWSADGQTLASGDNQGLVRLWRLDGSLIKTLTDQADAVTVLAWSSDNQTLASGSNTGTVWLWKNGSALPPLTGQQDKIQALAWSPDGRTLASGSWDHTIQLWKNDGTPPKVFTAHADWVRALAWSPNGQTLASGGADFTAKLWKSDGTPIKSLPEPRGGVTALAWSPDGQTLAAGSFVVRLWAGDGSTSTVLPPDNTAGTWDLAWLTDGQAEYLFAYENNAVRVYTGAGTLLSPITGSPGVLLAAAWTAKGPTIAVGSDDQTVRLYAPDGTSRAAPLIGQASEVTALSWAPNGQTLASGGEDGSLVFWVLAQAR